MYLGLPFLTHATRLADSPGTSTNASALMQPPFSLNVENYVKSVDASGPVVGEL